MDEASRRVLVAPAVLAGGGGVGLIGFLSVPSLAGWLHLAEDGTASAFLLHASGIWFWLASAWLASRCCDVLLRRVAVVSRGGVPYPRLLTDLIRAGLFATAAITI